MSNSTRVVLFLGTHRTGTTTLAGFFDENFSNVISKHQPKNARLINILSSMYLEGLITASVLKRFTQLTRVKTIRKLTIPYYIETNAFNYIIANFIKQEFDTRIVHIIRDPRDFVTSYMNWIQHRWQSYLAYYYVPYWNIRGYKVNELDKDQWKSYNKFEKFCWLWKFKNKKIKELYSGQQSKYLLMKFEDLISLDNYITVKNCLDFIGLPYKDKMEQYFNKIQNQSKKGFIQNWQKWDPIQCQQMDKICGNLMKEYNYGLDSAWINLINQ